MAKNKAAVSAEIRAEIEGLLYEAAYLIDEDKIDVWLELFVDDCLYKIILKIDAHRENCSGLARLDSRDALRERVLALRKAYVQADRYDYRHMINNVQIVEASGDDTYKVRSNYLLVRTKTIGAGGLDGETTLYGTGCYQDQIVFNDHGPRFQERIVITEPGGVMNFPHTLLPL